MKFNHKKIIFIICICLIATGILFAQEPIDLAELNYQTISPSVVMLHSQKEHGSNMACFNTDAGLVFFDCTLFTQIAAKFRADMEEKFQKKTLALVLSHGHTDHFFGMGAFTDVPVAASNAAKPMFNYQLGVDFHANVANFKRIFPRFDEALKTAELSMPDIWFNETIGFGSGDQRVEFHHTGGHSAGSCYGFMEKEGIISLGDNLQVDGYPYFGDPTGNMTTWIETLKSCEGLAIKHCLPGHGRNVDADYLTSTRVYFEDLVASLKQLKSKGVSMQEAVVHSDLPKGYWPSDRDKPVWWDRSVAGLFQSIQ